MSKIKKYFFLNNFVNLIFCFLPVSFILGSTILNLNILLLLFFSLSLVLKNKLKLNLSKIEYFLISFFLFYIFTTGLNIQLVGIGYFVKSIFSLRFLALYLLIKIMLENNKLDLNLFFKSCLVCTSLLCVDLFVQYIYGRNLLGMYPIEGRLSGFFGSEPIAGGYIQKLFLFSFLGIFCFFKKKNYQNLLIFLFLFLHSNAAIIANNRMSLILLMLTIIILTVSIASLRKTLALSLVAISISFYCILNFGHNELIGINLKKFANSLVVIDNKETLNNEITKGSKEEPISSNKFSFFQNTHSRLYASVIHSFKSNIFFGNGYKSFRINCKPLKSNDYKVNKKEIDDAIAKNELVHKQFCSTHPHNYALEVLHDTGIIGFILMSIFVILKLIKKIGKAIKRGNLNYVYYFTLLNFLIEIFPLKSTGSLFTTWNGTLAWLIVSLSLYELKKIKY